MRRMHVWAGAAIVLIAVLLAGWLIISPGWAVTLLQEQAQQRLGRVLTVRGGASIEFSPALAIRIDDASLDNPAGGDGAIMTARAIRIPVSPLDLVLRRADLTALGLEGAAFAFLVDERGQANWTTTDAVAGGAVALDISDSSARFYDARSQQALSLAGLRVAADIDDAGGLSVRGTAEINGRLAKIDAALKSIARVHQDGSPLDLSITVPDGSASFSGRMSTANLLGLVGPVTISTPDLRQAAAWAGIQVLGGAAQPWSIAGALESAGRAYSIRKANVTLGTASAQGDMALDLRGDRPNLQAVLGTAALALDAILPASGGGNGQWGSLPFDTITPKSLDGTLTLDAAELSLWGAALGPSRVAVTMANGKTESSLTTTSGMVQISHSLDGSVIPPATTLAMTLQGGEAQPLLAAMTGMPWPSGTGTVTASLSGSGQTALELAGTLRGTIAVNLTGGMIDGPAMPALLAAAAQRIVEGWSDVDSAATPFTLIAAAADVADGIAVLREASLSGEGVAVTVSGEIDLLRRALDLKATPMLRHADGQTLRMPVPLAVRGPWDSPRIYPDLPDLPANPAKGFESLKAMGLPPAD